MIKIGIIGAENSHSAAVAKTLNISKSVPEAKVVAIWGETAEYAQKSAEAGQIPTIVKKQTDLLGMIDALMVDHRHARFHLPAAEPFLQAGIPLFIDKPFCYRLAEGQAFLAQARKRGVPVVSFSTMPKQQGFLDFVKAMKQAGEVRTFSSYGPCDLASQWGGIFFYGIHQVDMILEAFGTDVEAVAVTRPAGAKDAVATLFYKSGFMAVMHCLAGAQTGFQLNAVTDAGPVSVKVASDADPYLAGIKTFVKMFKTGKEPIPHARILAPVAVLEAMEKSVKTGKVVAVAKV